VYRLVQVTPYPQNAGERRKYEAEQPLFLLPDNGTPIPLNPGDTVEVSVLYQAPDHKDPETAVVFQGRFVAVYPGLRNPEEALHRTTLEPCPLCGKPTAPHEWADEICVHCYTEAHRNLGKGEEV